MHPLERVGQRGLESAAPDARVGQAVLPATRGIVEEVVIKRWKAGLPFPRAGRATLQEGLTRSLAPIWLAGDYLGTWYTETAVQTGLAAATGAWALVTRPDRI